jgi:predicted DCC family thiol-disulfide oxidoreductase YuxK
MASAVASTRLAGPSSIPHPGAPRRNLAALPPPRRRDARHERALRARAAAVEAEAPGTSGRDAPAAAAEYFAADQRPIILFDGVCNLCNGGVNFMLDWDPAGRARFAALQSPAGRRLLAAAGRAPDDISSIVLCAADGAGGALVAHTKSDAILRIGQLLGLPFPALAALGFLVPSSIRDFLYDGVAGNRYELLGRQEACRLGDARFEERFLRD